MGEGQQQRDTAFPRAPQPWEILYGFGITGGVPPRGPLLGLSFLLSVLMIPPQPSGYELPFHLEGKMPTINEA